ncbi:MAG TPA: penicillin-binding protein 2 [Alphaproteobacteria bacterium]|nr:penicillin-binding protein 2 [Alphaproteobacteria bacterium]
MHRDPDRHKLFTRRAIMLGSGKLALLSTLVGRMYYLQVVEADRFRTLSDKNRISLRLLAPPRGRIVDRYGVQLAENRRNYRVVVISEQTPDVNKTLNALALVVPVSATDRRRVLREIKRKRSYMPVTVRDNLSWEEVARIEVNTPSLPGISIDVGQSRFYPYGFETAHVLGYVAAVSETKASDDPLLELPGFRVGKSGIEKSYDLALRGTGGSLQVEVNAYGRVVRELERRNGRPGVELEMTIDMELQKLAVERFKGQSGAAVVMDIRSGDIMSMISTPSFDPNAFNNGLSAAEWKELITNEKSPLINKAVAGQYSPGSTFKMVVALAALEKGAITPESEFFCPGFLKLGDAVFHCWKRGGHGIVNLAKGITESCDVYFYEVARRTGIDTIAAMAKKFGIGQIPGLELTEETAGLMPTREWKMATFGIPWQMGETLLAGIGQSYILTTPMQLALMTARLANGGYGVKPRLVREVDGPGGKVVKVKESPDQGPKSLGINPYNLEVVIKAMVAVVNNPRGTAYRARIRRRGYEIGGKTGTVQVRRITKAERRQGRRKIKDIPWKERDHAIFVGFGPVEQPRFAAAVVVEHGGGGSRVAAPIAHDLLLAVQRRGQLKPPPGRQAMNDPASPPSVHGLFIDDEGRPG